MKTDVKTDLRKKARIAAGMANLLQDDLTHLKADADDFDVICLEESIRDTKSTLQMLTDHVTEIEYMLYLINSRQ